MSITLMLISISSSAVTVELVYSLDTRRQLNWLAAVSVNIVQEGNRLPEIQVT